MRYTKSQILDIIVESIIEQKKLNETTTGALTGGVDGGYSYENAKTGGFFIGPLSHISKKDLNKRLAFKGGKIVDKVNGQPVTEQMILEWFGGEKITGPNKKPYWKGGKLVQISPKCQTFPYCSQGDSFDSPVRLISEVKDDNNSDAWEIIVLLAEAANKSPEYVAKLIREHYLKIEVL